MQIQIASPDDLGFIEGAYDHARAFMQAHGNATQWPEGYPGRIGAEEDIAHGHCFLVTDEAGPLAVFSFAPGPDETYASIDGAWHSDADYHVIHRVATVRGHGVARAIFSFAAEHADYLRCDTHEDNAPMRRRAYVLRVPRMWNDHGRQRYAARRLRLAQRTTRRQHPG